MLLWCERIADLTLVFWDSVSRQLRYLHRPNLPGVSMWLPLGFCAISPSWFWLWLSYLPTSLAFLWTLPSSSRYLCVAVSYSLCLVHTLKICLPVLGQLLLPLVPALFACPLLLLLPTHSVHFTSISNSSALSCPGIWMLFSDPISFSCCHLLPEPTGVLQKKGWS